MMTTTTASSVAAATMIQDVKVISVNPNLKTLGSLNPDLDISKRYEATADNSDSCKLRNILNLLTGIGVNTSVSVSSKILKTRVVFALFMALETAILIFSGDCATAIVCVLVSVASASGMMMRISSVCASVFFSYQLIISAMAGILDADIVMLAGSCMVMAILGPGQKSIDAAIRLFLFKKLNCLRIRRECESRQITYKAFRNSIGR